MKAICAVSFVVLGIAGSVSAATAQGYYGGGGYEGRGYEGRGYGGGGYEDRGYGGRGYGGGFDERDYLRCNPDVLRAVRRGQFESGLHHYRTFGRRERRRLSC
ncbi:hypothetical protein [Methylobacterium aerolatum]|uniref:Sulfur globule protein n=1 Tax=Methylobacterium aerolatum TaxID=418708 RepID=A0ABU0HYC3_9HYPH|nr:hypothetical protein [Methylobacterium aerolatum]MDQ0446818.1 hypothetical protein [Methylobacterium aerolatum]GJD33784.1 hypothetical protein FMGBMHLM_0677 [Methylobacterium aerolatum]